MKHRITNVRNILLEKKLDALFVTNQDNVTYLTGFSGLTPGEREGFLFITKQNAFLLTFPTYFGLYKDGDKGFTILNIRETKRLSDHLAEIIKKGNIKTVGFEKENLTVAELDSLKKKLARGSDLKGFKGLTPTEAIVENLRLIKDENEIACIKKAAEITDQAFDCIRNKITKSISEKSLAVELEYFIKKHADNIAFPPIVAFNQNAAIPHYLPSKNVRLKKPALVLLDFGAKINNYCSDITRVLFWGTPSTSQIKTYQTTTQVQQLALTKISVGQKCSTIDAIARNFIKSKGFPPYPHGLGHGVGLAIHEDPRLKKDSKTILGENMVVTVEPGIYLEGQYGIRIEDLVVLRRDGIEILSKSSKELENVILRH